jgi:hypothetical protein
MLFVRDLKQTKAHVSFSRLREPLSKKLLIALLRAPLLLPLIISQVFGVKILSQNKTNSLIYKV